MATTISMSATPNLQEMLKRHDTGLGLSESPPQSTTYSSVKDTKARTISTCTASSIKSDSTISSTRSRFHQGMLMPDATPDPTAKARHVYYRRRIQKQVFDQVPLDWKSAPVVCDEQYDYASLLYRPHLRCHASPRYLLEVQDTIRRQANSEAAKQRPGSEDMVNTVCIDGEEMIDMIG